MQTHKESTTGTSSDAADSFWSRDWLSGVVLFVATALLFYGCYLLANPFLPALAWALSFAIVASPAHRWISKRVGKPGLAAGLSVLLVAVIIVAPVALLLHTIVGKVAETLQLVQSAEFQKTLETAMRSNPYLAQVWNSLQAQPSMLFGNATKAANGFVKNALGGSVMGILTFMIALLVLFYFWRDQKLFTGYIRHFMPLSDSETSEVFGRLKDTVHASIFGTLVVASIQGTLGGLMFWWLGIPAPLLWGVAMGLLSVIPVLGAFVIWIPAAIFLALKGDWGKAIILTVWGTVVVGLIDNILFPVLVGKRLRLHTIPVFIGIVGGLAVFGASGLVLGPVVVALTDVVLNIWRCRTSPNRTRT